MLCHDPASVCRCGDHYSNGAPLATCLIQWLLWDYIKPFVWFFFYPTVFFSSRIGGRLAGIVSTLVSALLVVYFFMPPQFSFAAKNPSNLLSVLVFIVMGGAFSYTHDRLARADRQGAEAKAEALLAREQLQQARLALLQSEKQSSDDNLRASEERLDFALESCHIGAWELNLATGASFRSSEHHRIFGYPEKPPSWTYEMFLDHVLPEERALVDGTIGKALARQSDWNLECRIRRRDGEVRWIWVAGRQRQGEGGDSSGIAGIVQDITERKQSQEALQAVEMGRSLALDAAQAGTWEWELATRRNVWSKALWELYGLDESSCQPGYGTWLETVRPEDRPSLEQTLESMVQRGAEFNLEWQVNTRDGSERWLLSRGRPLRGADGSVTHYFGVVIDISERKAWEERLKRRNEELERFERASVEREFEMIRLKQRVNDLSAGLGVDPPYDLSFVATADTVPDGEQP